MTYRSLRTRPVVATPPDHPAVGGASQACPHCAQTIQVLFSGGKSTGVKIFSDHARGDHITRCFGSGQLVG